MSMSIMWKAFMQALGMVAAGMLLLTVACSSFILMIAALKELSACVFGG